LSAALRWIESYRSKINSSRNFFEKLRREYVCLSGLSGRHNSSIFIEVVTHNSFGVSIYEESDGLVQAIVEES